MVTQKEDLIIADISSLKSAIEGKILEARSALNNTPDSRQKQALNASIQAYYIVLSLVHKYEETTTQLTSFVSPVISGLDGFIHIKTKTDVYAFRPSSVRCVRCQYNMVSILLANREWLHVATDDPQGIYQQLTNSPTP